MDFAFQRNEILEFHRRVSLGFSQLVTKSLADLSRAQNVTTTQTYLISVRDMVETIKRLVTRAVKIVSCRYIRNVDTCLTLFKGRKVKI